MTEDVDPVACQRLWCAVMMEGVKNAVGIIHGLSDMTDASRAATLARAREWLDSEAFEEVALLSSMDPLVIRSAILSGKVTREDMLWAQTNRGRYVGEIAA